MSIHIVNIQQVKGSMEEVVNSDASMLLDIVNYSETAQVHAVPNCALLTLQNMVLNQAITFGEVVDKIIIGRIAISVNEFIVDCLDLGRTGVRLISSKWAKETYPEAKHEIVVTLIDLDDNTPHVFLIYV